MPIYALTCPYLSGVDATLFMTSPHYHLQIDPYLHQEVLERHSHIHINLDDLKTVHKEVAEQFIE
ncbi:hypothetical protein EON63_02950 [archaeon]|nr:MAG: hypothetical protein EON63_02950 [archaeon]